MKSTPSLPLAINAVASYWKCPGVVTSHLPCGEMVNLVELAGWKFLQENVSVVANWAMPMDRVSGIG
jgi:hypothetical protein